MNYSLKRNNEYFGLNKGPSIERNKVSECERKPERDNDGGRERERGRVGEIEQASEGNREILDQYRLEETHHRAWQ